MLEQALKKIPDATGLGGDHVEPSFLKNLPKVAKQKLVELMQEWEESMALPEQLLYNFVALIPKPDWSDRPITLLPILVRLYFKMRLCELNGWCEENQKKWDAAVKGKSAVRAALQELLMDEIAQCENTNRATIAWDLEKFYDSISIKRLVEAAIKHKYPGVQLVLGLRCYLGPRMVTWAGQTSHWVNPDTSITAGCVQGNHMARMIVYHILEQVEKEVQDANITQFVDDCTTACQGSTLKVKNDMAKVAEVFHKQCERQGLKINAHKSAISTRSAELSKQVQRKIEKESGLKLLIEKEVKLLGINKSAGTKRAVSAASKRKKAAEQKMKRAHKLGKARKIASRIWATGAMPQITFNKVAQGATPTEVKGIRSMAAAACQLSAKGWCATTAISLTYGEGGDPAIQIMRGQIKEWLHVWKDQTPDIKKKVTRAWVATKHRLANVKAAHK